MVDSLFNPSTLSAELVFWLLLSLVAVMGRLVSIDRHIQEEVERQPEKVKEIIPSSARARSYMSLSCIVLLVASGIMLTMGPFRADMELQRGLKLEAEGSPEAVFALSRATEIQPALAMSLISSSLRSALLSQSHLTPSLLLIISLQKSRNLFRFRVKLSSKKRTK